VHCVVGSEMGAFVGALYSLYGGNTNSVQWQLFKLNKENYFNFPLLSLRDPKSSGSKLNDFLQAVFRQKKIEDLPIRFAAVASDADGDSPVILDRGEIAPALSASLAMPGIFDPWKVNGESLASGAVASPVPVELARSLGGTFFVLVDVLDEAPRGKTTNNRFQKAFAPVRNLIRLQKRDVSFVIPVRAGNIPFDEFSRQGEVLSIGAKAAEQYVPQLKEAWEKIVAVPR
jgi:NTE family protein